MKTYIAIFIVLLSVLSTSCKKKKKGSVIPSIGFIELTPNTVRSGNSEDTVFIRFKITDGDADLGNTIGSNLADIYVKDSRDTTENGYYFPTIPKEVLANNAGVTGECTLKVYASLFLIKRSDIAHENGDTLHYDIYVKDRAQHKSNVIKTPDIYITL